MIDRCVVCGEIVPEGRQICPVCEKGVQIKYVRVYGRDFPQPLLNIRRDAFDKIKLIPVLKEQLGIKAKTYAEDYFEKFPNGVKFRGKPWLCRRAAYGGNCKKGLDNLVFSCDDCWNEEMKE